MDDVTALVREVLHEDAEDTPPAGELLAAVHARSSRLARRRRLTAVAAVAMAVAAAVAVPVLAGGGGGQVAQPGPTSTATGTGTASPPADQDGLSRPPPSGSSVTAETPVRLESPAYTAPTFPFRPGTTPAGGLTPPVVTLEGGELKAFYAARDPVRGADVTITVGPRRPMFDAPADRSGPVRESARQTRGRPATLRTVTVKPAARLSLYWQESGTRWVRVDTDDTLTDTDLVRLADTLSAAAVPVVAPFRLDLAPAGMVLDTASPSTMAFRPGAATTAALTCTLLGPRALTGRAVAIGPYRGAISRTSAHVRLAVALDDRQVTLSVDVPAPYSISDADLIRFAAGVHVTDHAEPRTD